MIPINFSKIVAEIDAEMKTEKIPIESRLMHILPRLSKQLKIRFTTRHDDEVYRFIVDWYEKKYGDRQRYDHSIGEIAVLIRNDLFRMKIPLVYGQVEVIIDPNSFVSQIFENTGSKSAKLHVLNCIENLTKTYAKELSRIELRELMLFFQWGLSSFQSISYFQSKPFIKEAIGDLRSAVYYLFCHPQQCGQSKWASLQAAEKFIKAYRVTKGGNLIRTHKLKNLAEDAYALGLCKLNPDNLEIIQCGSGVRYGEVNVDVHEAVESHHAAIDVCAKISGST